MRKRQDFIAAQDGVSAIEFALLAPVLLFLLLSSVTLYDAFRANQIVVKATSTIADMVSRKSRMNPNTTQEMDDFLNQVVPLSGQQPALRLTSVSNVLGVMTIDWSDAAGNIGIIETDEVDLDALPDIAIGDSVIVTETYVPFTAMFTGYGIGSMTFGETLVNRPRLLRQIPFDD